MEIREVWIIPSPDGCKEKDIVFLIHADAVRHRELNIALGWKDTCIHPATLTYEPNNKESLRKQ